MEASIKPRNDGNRKIESAHTKLQTTEIMSDFFLPIVSAKTEVGSSNNRIVMVEILAIRIICARESPLY